MKPFSRIFLIFAAFAGILTVSSPNYAGTLVMNPVLGVQKNFPAIPSRSTAAGHSASFEKKKPMDPYAQALKIARVLSTSA